jgi:hypothetical protein
MSQPRGFLIAIALTMLLAACAHADWKARLPEEQFPDPMQVFRICTWKSGGS